MKTRLSVVLATHNEGENIVDCLNSAKDLAYEFVIVDGCSTDRTVLKTKKLIKKFQEKRPGLKFQLIKTTNKLMFHKNKQVALQKATGNWILQLDADERVTRALTKEIKVKIKNSKSNVNAYYIPRRNYFLGKFLKKSGQYPDYVIRLVKKGKAYFPCQSVHEQISFRGQSGYLKNALLHYTAPTFSRYFKNANRYTTLTAKSMKENNIRLNLLNYFKYLVWLPIKTFFSIFIRHKGFLDGIYGFLFAIFSGFHHAWALLKYWEHKKLGLSFNTRDDR
jgi:glycosyltransferase involved in cell wall biosynthesis